MVEFNFKHGDSEKFNSPSFYDRIYALLIEDGLSIKYGDFCSRVLANGCIKVLKSLKLYKVTGARNTKKIFIHEKVLMVFESTVADNSVIAKTVIKLVDGYYNGLEKFNIDDLDDFYRLSDDYPYNIDSKKSTYLIYNPNNQLYKIGKARDVFSRLNQLKNDFSKDLELCAWCNIDIEYLLHKEYSDKRVFGEWFSMNSDDILDIKNKHNFTVLKLNF